MDLHLKNDSNAQIVALCLFVPVGIQPVAPPGNYIGVLMLVGLIKARLMECDLLSEQGDVGATGELNECVVMAPSTNAMAALPVIRKVVEDLCLLACCRIGYFDTREEIWRAYWPQGCKFDVFISDDRIKAITRDLRKLIQSKPGGAPPQ